MKNPSADTHLINSRQINTRSYCSFWSRWNCGQKTGAATIGIGAGGLVSSFIYVAVIGSSGLAMSGIGMAASALVCATGIVIFKGSQPIDMKSDDEYQEPPSEYSINP